MNSVQSGSQQHSGFAATEHEEVVQYTDFAFHLPVKSVMMIGVMRKYNLRDAGAQAPLRFFFFFFTLAQTLPTSCYSDSIVRNVGQPRRSFLRRTETAVCNHWTMDWWTDALKIICRVSNETH